MSPNPLARTALLLAVLLAPPALAAEPAAGDSIAKVNGVSIPKERFDLIVRSQTQQGQQDTAEFREEVREVLITREVLAQEALRKKLDKDPAYRAQMDAMRQQILLGLLLEDFLKQNAPTDEQLRAEYERAKAELLKVGDKEYLSRHILVKDQSEAKALIEQLGKGADFAALAREKSLDPGTKDQGGQLDWSKPEVYVAAFADALRKLKKGELLGEPVRTSYGWHVIQVVDIRDPSFPAFEEVKEQIRENVINQARDDYVGKLREKAKIEKLGSLGAAKQD